MNLQRVAALQLQAVISGVTPSAVCTSTRYDAVFLRVQSRSMGKAGDELHCRVPEGHLPDLRMRCAQRQGHLESTGDQGQGEPARKGDWV